MVVELTAEQGDVLLRLARADGRTPAEILIETAQWLHEFANDEAEQRLLDQRLADADEGGKWVSAAEMDERVRQMLGRG